MARSKAKTVTARIVVFFDREGRYMAAGDSAVGTPRNCDLPCEGTLLAKSDELQASDLPHACIVDVDLEVPQPPKGKVRKVKQVKP